ncbi:MAG: hypothetical protein GY917_20375, partial [Planctomycetaceae bacterium]|nr:hypothetical protein [Planctomycetaceae bacterium]
QKSSLAIKTALNEISGDLVAGRTDGFEVTRIGSTDEYLIDWSSLVTSLPSLPVGDHHGFAFEATATTHLATMTTAVKKAVWIDLGQLKLQGAGSAEFTLVGTRQGVDAVTEPVSYQGPGGSGGDGPRMEAALNDVSFLTRLGLETLGRPFSVEKVPGPRTDAEWYRVTYAGNIDLSGLRADGVGRNTIGQDLAAFSVPVPADLAEGNHVRVRIGIQSSTGTTAYYGSSWMAF